MSTTTVKFSPSVNIIRDKESSFEYIVTPNGERVFADILSHSLTGFKSHLLIGAYGTGKSAFLLALKQTLAGKHVYFKESSKAIKKVGSYDFLPIVGEYGSAAVSFAQTLRLTSKATNAEIFKELTKQYKQVQKKGKGLIIVLDEFGKFLEYAAKHSPEKELYFLQQLAEWVNDPSINAILITTLHQDFSSYSNALNASQRYEWDKIKGRFKEHVFNEPVEQLLNLAAEKIAVRGIRVKSEKDFQKLFNQIQQAKAFSLSSKIDEELAKKFLPLDTLAAAVLTLSLQRYGQNERSLFSFVQSWDAFEDEAIRKGERYFSIPEVYDYLLNNHYSLLTTKYNPDYLRWQGVRKAIEKIEGVLSGELLVGATRIIKTIGLLNIYAHESAKLDDKFFLTYGKLAMGIADPTAVIEKLHAFKIIHFVKHNTRYTISYGTDLDIQHEINEAGKIITKVENLVNQLNLYFDFPFIAAKAVSYQLGTPRFFQFKLSEAPESVVPEGEIDGYINLVFSAETNMADQIQKFSQQCDEPILFGYYSNTEQIQETLLEIQKVNRVINQATNDKVALDELKKIEDHYRKLLNHYVMDSLYDNHNTVVWYYKGNRVAIGSRQRFNQTLSNICNQVYSGTPRFVNDLMNKTNISGQISNARKTIGVKMLNEADKPYLGLDTTKFPPERSIYLSLLLSTGIHREEDGVWGLQQPTDSSYQQLWDACENFLASTRTKDRYITELIETLSNKPFKLKQGFIEFWVPIFLLTKADEYALYNANGYLPVITDEILDLINKKPSLFRIKAFNVSNVRLQLFNRYRVMLSQGEHEKPTNKVFIQTVRPFLVFYKDLPEYAKRTSRLSKKAIAMRGVIALAKDPEKTFFEDFPAALGYSVEEMQHKPEFCEAFIKEMRKCIKEIQTSYDKLIERFENYLKENILGVEADFLQYKAVLKNRYKGLKTHLLLNEQKSFFTRINSELDDRTAWLNSIAQACIGKPLNSITDEEEFVLYDRLNEMVQALDNLVELSKMEINEDAEEVLKLELTSFVQGINKSLLRIPKTKSKEIIDQHKKIKVILGKDKKLGITVLATLIQELIGNEKEG